MAFTLTQYLTQVGFVCYQKTEAITTVCKGLMLDFQVPWYQKFETEDAQLATDTDTQIEAMKQNETLKAIVNASDFGSVSGNERKAKRLVMSEGQILNW